ncbi:MAG: o-succinylbenzoate--CoA ligase [Myxococcota bacterium]|nr:o-succinylbenzoate--CoA ligase [Myxococcota bacterium]
MKTRDPWLDGTRDPDAETLVCAGRRTTRAELAAQADALAAWLAAQGVSTRDHVAALLPNGPAFVALLHAVDRLGATLLPLNLRLAAPELAFVLADARPALLLHGPGPLAALARQVAANLRTLPAPEPADLPPAEPRQPAGDPGDPFALLYTSGTTGRPKGALLSHASLAASADASARHLRVPHPRAPRERWLDCLPLFHVGGLSILLRGARHGHPTLLHERFDPEAVGRALDGEGVTHVSLVPTMLARLLEVRGARRCPDTLALVLLGGGPAAPELLERALALGFPIAPTYGLTEAASQVATLPPGRGTLAHDGLAPLPGIELRIVDDAGETHPPGQVGEIAVRGPTLMSGYLRRPDDTRRALRDGWLHTGDLGRVDDRGHLFVLDRRSDLVVSGGENVYPAEVEAVLAEHPDVAEAGVAGVPDPDFGQRPVAWVVPKSSSRVDAESLAAFCRERLAAYKVPDHFRFVRALPRNASGKIQRHRLWEPPHSSP